MTAADLYQAESDAEVCRSPAPEWVSMCARCRTEHGPFVYDHGTTVCEVCIGKIGAAEGVRPWRGVGEC